jgi:hypothetical protein
MLAPAMALTDNSIDAARVVPLLCAIGALAALYWLGRLMVGHRAACAGVVLAALAAGPSHLSARFFVDTPSAMWLFGSAAALVAAHRSHKGAAGWCMFAGALLGLAFLTKETAAAWVALPLVVALLSPSSIGPRSLFAFYATFAALVAPWFGWVAFHAGIAFKLDMLPMASMSAVSAATVVGALSAWRFGWLHNPRIRVCLALLTLAGWALVVFLVLESRAEPHSRHYMTAVPDWTARVFATSVEPWAFITVAWAYACWRAVVERTEALAVVLVAAAGTPLFVSVANQGWELRQVIWLAYLSYLVLGWAVLDAVSRLAATWRPLERHALALACVVALGLVAGFASATGSGARSETARNWRNDDEREIAHWLDDLPDSANILSSRLYYSQLYVDGDGRIPIRQLPTLGVTIRADGRIAPFGTLFRYEDADLTPSRHWIWFQKYHGRPYAVALGEEDLLAAIRDHRITHVLLTGDDAGFSSLAYRAYFDTNDAFRVVRSSSESGAVMFEVRQDLLQVRHPPLVIDPDSLDYVAHEAGAIAERPDYWETIAPSGVLFDAEQLLRAGDLAVLSRELRTE